MIEYRTIFVLIFIPFFIYALVSLVKDWLEQYGRNKDDGT